MSRWRKLAWTCAIILAAAEYSWLSVINQVVPPIPKFMAPVVALLFPAAVFAMLGTVVFVAVRI